MNDNSLISLNIMDNTLLFYDKFASIHNYTNSLTSNTTIQDVINSDSKPLLNIDAINEFNKFGNHHYIEPDLDFNLYTVYLYVLDNNHIYTLIGINNALLYELIDTNKPVPNTQFMKELCRNHNAYNQFSNNKNIFNTCDESEFIGEAIIDKIKQTTGDKTDMMIAQPSFIKCKLYDYQKQSIYWMLETEKKSPQAVLFNINEELLFKITENKYTIYDLIKQKFYTGTSREHIYFNGGALIDEMGLGKTIQITTLALLNPVSDMKYFRPNSQKIHSKANLILCPNQICGQWKRELEKMINIDQNIKIVTILTKTHYDKLTYIELLDADFIIISFNFFENKVYLNTFIHLLSNSKSFYKHTWNKGELDKMNVIFDTMVEEFKNEPKLLFNTNVIFQLIKWNRIIVDEFHEIYNPCSKYSYMDNILTILTSNYKWAVTGTPFDKSNNCLVNMINFIADHQDKIKLTKTILNSQNICNHIQSKLFRRNTKQSIELEHNLRPLNETVIRLKFTHTERMIYNAYLVNQNNSKFSVLLRQLCCHPKLADETKEMLSNCKTLDDIQKLMVVHYEKDMIKSKNNLDAIAIRLDNIKKNTKMVEYKRQRKLLIKLGYDAEIKQDILDDFKILENSKDINILSDDEIMVVPPMPKNNSKSKNNIVIPTKIIVSDSNQEEIKKIINDLASKNISKTLVGLIDTLNQIQSKYISATKDYEGKLTTFNFYNNVFNRIKKTKNNKIENNKIENKIEDKPENKPEDKPEDKPDEENEEMCGICLCEIPENNIGVTICGHLYCFECIKTSLAHKNVCPYCRKELQQSDVYLISYEKEKSKISDKSSLINEIGTKLTNIIFYLKSLTKDDNVIIFSQWDDLLKKIGNCLDDYGIKNVFCQGSVWQRDKAIMSFNNDENIRVIMLSSESSASGTNLTKANKVIIVDPVCGTYEYRKNMEGQAIGRAHRMGQTRQVEILRFIITDTIEEDIYNANKLEDTKHININIQEETEDKLVLTQDKMDELNNSYINKTRVVKKKNKRIICSDSE